MNGRTLLLFVIAMFTALLLSPTVAMAEVTKLVDLRPVEAHYLTRKNAVLPDHPHGDAVWSCGAAFRVWNGGHFWRDNTKIVKQRVQLPDDYRPTAHPGGYKSWDAEKFVVNGASVTGVGLWLRVMSMEHWIEYDIPRNARSFHAIAMLTDDNRGYMHGQGGNNYAGFRNAILKVLIDGQVVDESIEFSHFGRHGMRLGEIDLTIPKDAKRIRFHLIGSDDVDWNKNTELVINEGVFDTQSVTKRGRAGSRVKGGRDHETTIRFELPTDGRASLGVYDQTDRLLRVLLHGERERAGSHEVVWDGLDWQGKPVSPGDYTWRLVHSPGLTSRFLFRLGTTVPDEPWQRWVGDHVPVSSMAADAKGFVFTSYFIEIPDMIIGFDRTLKNRTVATHQWYDGNELTSTGIANGKLLGLTRAGQIRVLNRDTLKIEATWPYIATPSGQFVSPNDLAAAGATLVATDVASQKIHYLDPATGKRTRSIDIAEPKRLACTPDGSVYVSSGNQQVFVISPDGHIRTLIDDGLLDPQAITVDPTSGDLFVFDAGASSQIKQFDSSGKPLRVFGREGGRQPIPYAADDFAGVRDLLADGDGHVLVAEMGVVRRVAKLDIDSGKVVDQWFGGNGYYNYAIVHPEDPTDVWFEPSVNALQRVRMDYDDGTWAIQAAYAPSPPLPGGGVAGFPYLRWFPFVHQGRRYLLNSNHWLYVEDEQNKTLRAIRIVEKKGNVLTVWSDLNEDQQRTDNEVITYTADAANKFAKISWIDDNRNLYFQGPGGSAFSTLGFGGWSQVNPAIPTWDYESVQAGPELPDPLKKNPGFGSLYVDAKGRVHQTRGAMRMPGDERHGHFWPAIELSVAKYMQWTGATNARLRSMTGKHQTDWSQSQQNVLTQPGIIIGEVDGVIAACDRAGQPTGVAFDVESGLYVGNLLENRADDGLPEWVYDPWKRVDFGGGQFFKLDDGRAIWLMQDWNNHAVMEVTGLDAIRRVDGTVRLGRPGTAAIAKGTGLSGTYFRSQRFRDKALTQVDPFFRFGPRNTNDYGHKSAEWIQTLQAQEVPLEQFSVVWEGELEPPVDEEYQFSMYLTGDAKLYLDGRLVLDTTVSGAGLFKGYQHNVSGDARMGLSDPVRLKGGVRIPIRIEWKSSGTIREKFLGYTGPMFHLNWETPVHDRLAIPTRFLYPGIASPDGEE